jgi:lipopolysaccharide biosynthesis protein/glycosyltransferase involved in cell wall biosynthesis
MAENIKVSVLLTSYNHEKYLHEAIDSVLRQTLSEIELIIIENGSTDGSWEIIQSYKDPRIIIIRIEKNIFPIAAIEYGLSRAKGKYVAFLPSDDIWEQDKLEKQIKFMEAHPEHAACFTWVQYIDDSSEDYDPNDGGFYTRYLFEQPNRSRFEWLRLFFNVGNRLCFSSAFIRRTCFNETRLLDKGLSQLPDFLMWIRICMHAEIYVLPEKLTRYRLRSNEQNESGDRLDSRIRSSTEHYFLIQEFLKMTDRTSIFEVFPEARRYLSNDKLLLEYALARICLEESHPATTKLVGLELLHEIINDPTRAAIAEKLYGFTHVDLISTSGKHDIFSSVRPERIQRATIFADFGDGFRPEISDNIITYLPQSGAFLLQFDLASLRSKGNGDIHTLRFDPSEGFFIKCKIHSVKIDGQSCSFSPYNSIKSDAGFEEFITTDPIYILGGDFSGKSLTVRGSIQVLDNLTSGVLFEEILHESDVAVNDLTAKLHESDVAVNDLTARIDEIKRSQTWRVGTSIMEIKQFFLPSGSWRERVAKGIFVVPMVLIQKIKTQRNLSLIRSSNLFDETWYLKQNLDVAKSKVDPGFHYLVHGAFEGRDPSPRFSSNWYLQMYPDVKASGVNPLLHYIKFGEKEGRTCTATGENPRLVLGQKKNLIKTGWTTLQERGLRYLLRRILIKIQQRRLKPSASKDAELVECFQDFRVVPYYLDQCREVPTHFPHLGSIAIHLHLFYEDMMEQCIHYLANIPAEFDLFVSVPKDDKTEVSLDQLRSRLPLMRNIIVRKIPNRGRDIAPLIIEFGQSLLKYDFIAHIHTKKSPHNPHLSDWFTEIMGAIFGSPGDIYQILQLLAGDAKFVYPAPSLRILTDRYGWGDNFSLARDIAAKFLKQRITQQSFVEFPQGTMFWARSTALDGFLSLPFRYSDFPVEPIPADGTLAHALERLLFIASNKVPGRNYCIYTPTSVINGPYYEKHVDYSERIVHDTVKVLSYYLPQFYPIPENDLWHGEGFTEWSNVRRTNPLFYGHYQQRIPHDDIGYYSLITPDVLRQQSTWMKQAGVYGQVFYHYWFSGKLILEKPTQMLLQDTSIDMPFCFCWANENWTRKWDGNENEILLQQNYSADDAAEFIKYLIPFFKDARYIRIENRPVLFIYRPSSIPEFSIYQKVWQKVCEQNDIPTPYVVAVLTRGATSPQTFGMEAGVERVLHDWTNGYVKNIKDTLHHYWDVNGSVLDYNEVADYYINQPAKNNYTYFRSIIPSWDNTPRYGSEAYIVHNSTPKKFQQWLEHLVSDSEQRLPADRRFVLVNAWNEWAESASLDPDKQFGYAYLNSIGRALSGLSFNDREYLQDSILPKTTLVITLDERLLHSLKTRPKLRRKMLTCLVNSTIFSVCDVSFGQPELPEWIAEIDAEVTWAYFASTQADYTIYFAHPCFFPDFTLENMLKMGQHYEAGVVIPSERNNPQFSHDNLSSRWEATSFDSLHLPPLLLINNGYKRSAKCCVDAPVFVTGCEHNENNNQPVISTIIRFHQSGDRTLLQNALFSLLAQHDCIVQPIIAIQDLSEGAIKCIKDILDAMPWHPDYPPIIRLYHSHSGNEDLRSVMLNETLMSVRTRYAAFLDYDDILFPSAYYWLTSRLKITGKNATFGLLYTTIFNVSEQMIKARHIVYDYGKNFKDFYKTNHTPVHGFLLDISKINLSAIEYDPAMRYLEDYYLTLQIFTEEETDWKSLHQRQFIGDYYHYEDKPQTLANLVVNERVQLLNSPDYLACKEKVELLKQKICKL